nr:ArlX5 [Gefionella okellyi]
MGGQESRQSFDFVLAGLDGSGRSTWLYQTLCGYAPKVTPTGISMANMVRLFWRNFEYNIIDTGFDGTSEVGWSRFLEKSHGVIFAVDHSDLTRLDLAKDVLHNYILSKLGPMVPLLLLVTKMDLDGLSVRQVALHLQLDQQKRPWFAAGVSFSGLNHMLALDWLGSACCAFADNAFLPSEHGVLLLPPWTPDTHKLYPRKFKRIVRTLLLCAGRKPSGSARHPQAWVSRLPSRVLERLIAAVAEASYNIRQIPPSKPVVLQPYSASAMGGIATKQFSKVVPRLVPYDEFR